MTVAPTPELNLNLASGPKNFYTYLPIFRKLANPKKGLGWSHISDNDDVSQLQISWFHNWNSKINYERFVPSHLDYIPFLWCDFDDKTPPTNLLNRAINELGTDYAGYLLFLNEPDLGVQYGQCGLTDPNDAAAFYVETRYTFPEAKLIGPHNFHDVSWHSSAIDWVTEWRQAVYNYTCSGSNPYPNEVPCGYPEMAGYGIHPYEGTTAENIQFIDDFYNLMVSWGESDKELWVTEWGYCITQGDAGIQVTNTVSEFENRPFVTRYAYFTNRTPGLGPNMPPTGPDCWDTDLFDPFANPPWSTLSNTGAPYRDAANP